MNVKAILAAACLGLLFLSQSTTSTVKTHRWKPMQYPATAWTARIEGTVTISASLTKCEYGDYCVGKYEVQSGHPVLRQAVVENLREQSFYPDDHRSLEGEKYQVTYEFRFDKECLEEQQCFKSSTTFRSGRVLVEASAREVATTDSKK